MTSTGQKLTVISKQFVAPTSINKFITGRPVHNSSSSHALGQSIRNTEAKNSECGKLQAKDIPKSKLYDVSLTFL